MVPIELQQPKILRRVLGIDPSLRGTGWAVVAASGGDFTSLGYGTVKIKQQVSQSVALLMIFEEITSVIERHTPNVCAIESTIYVQSYQTAITLGSARGASILAAAKAGLEIVEFAPRRVKQAVTGRGGAQKEQVAFMIRALLGLDHTPDPDAADALGVALAFLQQDRKADVLK
jgi:crossover junction endodeoxyribonuclease RuvC